MQRTAYPLPKKLTVWAGIFGDKVVELFFLDGSLNEEIYLELVDHNMDPMLTNNIKNNDPYMQCRPII